ncbi:AP2-associated protein kinase 1-like [Bombina bombina]|uniref:AP2-associated protein kinase 1-like n=1 Tax=Bombina bombina TaxID=8345 RepID=UPI00235AA2D8|nr:AP2-associated protein kinase 1-like [Bombina bombina]XP_053551169.1 AP2-associated protein kinase 1-like [Bombina bombina]
MSQEVPTGQAEWSHTGHQWDYQSTLRAPPYSSLGRAPPSSSLGRASPSSSLGRAPPSAEEHIAESTQAAADAAEPAPQAPPDVAEPAPQAAANVAEPAPQAPPDVAEPAPQAAANAAEPAPQAPRSPAAQEPVDALYSPLWEEYIALQRRLITSTENIQRTQERFFRSQQRRQQRSIELQRDIAASLSASVHNQSQMMRILSDLQMQMDNRCREQNQLLGVLVEHFTHQQDTASSLSSVASTPAETEESSQTRRTRQSTTATSAVSYQKPKNK